MMYPRCFLAGAALALAVSTLNLQAQIVRYDLTGLSSTTAPASTPATTVASGLVASPLTRGPGINPAGLGNGFSANNWNGTATMSGINSASLANAITTGDFFQFAVTIDAGYAASFATLDVSLRRSAVAAPMNYQWHYSLDGFATPGVGFANFNYYGRNSGTAPVPVVPYSWMTTDVGAQGNGNPMTTLDLTAISAFQDIAGGTTVSFRLYGWGDDAVTGAADSNTVALGRYDGPTIGGTVTVVPEPSVFGLMALGLGALVLRRKRKAHATMI